MKLLAADIKDIKDVFGTIKPPDALQPFTSPDKTGGAGISLFLNNLITLIYIVAGIVFVFMILWGALSWLISGGDKEKVAGAQRRITSAIIGIVLMGVAFAIIRVIGTFTGFTFFDQKDVYYREANGQCTYKRCPSGVDKPGECVFEKAPDDKCPPITR